MSMVHMPEMDASTCMSIGIRTHGFFLRISFLAALGLTEKLHCVLSKLAAWAGTMPNKQDIWLVIRVIGMTLQQRKHETGKPWNLKQGHLGNTPQKPTIMKTLTAQ